MRFSLVRLIFLTSLAVLMSVSPYLGTLLLKGASNTGFLAALILIHCVYAQKGHEYSRRWHLTLGFPVAVVVMVYTLWRSTFITLRQGGILWRGTFYPLDQLKDNIY